MKIYISGAITDNPDYIEQFKRAEQSLIARDHAVVNPARARKGFEYKEYIDMGLCQLMQCEAIYMLNGWSKSRGARLEYKYARAVDLKIFYQSEDEEYAED